jgi:hypothetical protein
MRVLWERVWYLRGGRRRGPLYSGWERWSQLLITRSGGPVSGTAKPRPPLVPGQPDARC